MTGTGAPPVPGLFEFVRELCGLLTPYRARTLLQITAISIEQAFHSALLPLSFQLLIDQGLRPGHQAILLQLLVALAAGTVVASAARLWQDYLYAGLGTAVINDLRVKMFAHLQELSMSFFGKHRLGDIMARFSTDLAPVEYAVTMSVPVVIICAIGFLFSVVPMMLLEWRLSLFAITGLFLCCTVGTRRLEKKASEAGYRVRELQSGLSSMVQENVSGQSVVKAFGLHPASLQSFTELTRTVYKHGVRASFLSYVLEDVPNISILFFTLVVLGAGAWLSFHGLLSVGQLIAFHALFVSISSSVYGLTWAVPNLVQAAAGMQRINELLAQRPSVQEQPDAPSLPPLVNSIRLENVTFSYTGEQASLRNVSLDIRAGSSVAFVGSSGSGKSTVMNLIMRFYDPGTGRVTFDGRDVRRFSQASLRAQIGVVFQENILFNTTIRENIRMGNPEATDAQVEAAARDAEIHEFIAGLPDGYDTIVGERGGRLSGGERQRVAIARAIVRDPAILILDEATSALDPVTEASLDETLERVSQGRTVISVTHRLGRVLHADQIFVMDRGELAEQGRHSELLRLGGVYSRLWDSQTFRKSPPRFATASPLALL